MSGPAILSYDVSPNSKRRIVAALILGIVLGVSATIGIQSARGRYDAWMRQRAAARRAAAVERSQRELRMWQDRCMVYEPPSAGMVVYTREPTETKKLLAGGQGYVQPAGDAPAACYVPACWEEYRKRSGSSIRAWTDSCDAIAFVHAMRTTSGRQRLVALGVHRWKEAGQTRLNLALIDIGSNEQGYDPTKRLTANANENVRVFAAELDPADASHFTVRVEVEGQPHTYDGCLNDAGAGTQVTLREREGSIPLVP
jgi:type II secretory pathway pseudopilin PulG